MTATPSKATRLAQLEDQLAAAAVALGDARRAYDTAAADALLAGTTEPSRKALDKADDRHRVLHTAVVRLRLEVEAEAVEQRQLRLEGVRRELGELHAERQSIVNLATAMQHVAARLFALSLGSATGGGPWPPRLAGMANTSDWPDNIYGPRLKDITVSLNQLGVEPQAARRETKAPSDECPVDRTACRALSEQLRALLVESGLVPEGTLPPITP